MYLASWALFEWLIFLADPSREAHPDPTPWPQFSKWPVEKCWGLAGVISYSLLWGFLFAITSAEPRDNIFSSARYLVYYSFLVIPLAAC
jgi:hypothetical protein